MKTINVSLPDKLKNQADKLVKHGYYASFSDLVRSALRGQLMTGEMKIKTSKSEREIIESELIKFAKENKVKRLSLFGSVSREEIGPDSDVDVLVRFSETSKIGLLELMGMEQELSDKLNRKVELITKLNKYIKPYALKDIVTLYERR